MMNLIEIISNLLFSNNGVSNVPIDDEVLNTYNDSSYNEILKHHKSYSDLLDGYVKSSIINLLLKIIFKLLFFCFALYVWYIMIKLFQNAFDFSFNLLKPENNLDFIDVGMNLLGTILPSLISLITSFIVIPEIIARYLFNTGEEQSLIEIIKSLQTYDQSFYEDNIKSELHARSDIQSEGENGSDDESNSQKYKTENQNNEEDKDNNNKGA